MAWSPLTRSADPAHSPDSFNLHVSSMTEMHQIGTESPQVEVQIQQFRKKRFEARVRVVRKVLIACLVTIMTFSIGLALSCVAYVRHWVDYTTVTIFNFVPLMCHVLWMNSLFSICPTDDYPMDDFLRGAPRVSMSLYGVFCIMSVILCAAWKGIGISAVLLCTFQLGIGLYRKDLELLPSSFVSLWLILFTGELGHLSLRLSIERTILFEPPVVFGPEARGLLSVYAALLWSGDAITWMKWIQQRGLYKQTGGKFGLCPQANMWQVFHRCVTLWSTPFLVGGVVALLIPSLAERYAREKFWMHVSLINFLIGAGVILPPLVIMALGRERIFQWVTRNFDRNQANLDGAFLAELLTDRNVVAGMPWWVHHGRDEIVEDPFDPRRNWSRAVVVEVRSDEFVVETCEYEGRRSLTMSRRGSRSSTVTSERLPISDTSRMGPPSSYQHRVNMLDRQVPAEKLFAMARANLRCIDWEGLSFELMSGSSIAGRTQGCFSLSRPVQPGEEVDYFMSHSWHDDAMLKWQGLRSVVQSFYQKHGRYPTFWLDKVCIDQSNISDGLRVLPINIMACHKMLVLCGPTYPRRLWCAWELCTLFSFMSQRRAFERIEILTLQLGEDDENSKVLKQLLDFDVDLAHCYDPNEEGTLRTVINAIGKRNFNARIRSLASQCLSRNFAHPKAFDRYKIACWQTC